MVDPKMKGISVGPCRAEGCTCRGVVVRLHDANQQAVSGISLPRATAVLFLMHLTAALNEQAPPAPSELHSIRCEGTA